MISGTQLTGNLTARKEEHRSLHAFIKQLFRADFELGATDRKMINFSVGVGSSLVLVRRKETIPTQHGQHFSKGMCQSLLCGQRKNYQAFLWSPGNSE